MKKQSNKTNNLVKSIFRFSIAMLANYFLTITTPGESFLILGIIFLIALVFILKWMKPRFGLKAEEYDEKDIKFKQINKPSKIY